MPSRQKSIYLAKGDLAERWFEAQNSPSKSIRELINALVHQYGIQDFEELKQSLHANEIPLMAELQPLRSMSEDGRISPNRLTEPVSVHPLASELKSLAEPNLPVIDDQTESVTEDTESPAANSIPVTPSPTETPVSEPSAEPSHQSPLQTNPDGPQQDVRKQLWS